MTIEKKEMELKVHGVPSLTIHLTTTSITTSWMVMRQADLLKLWPQRETSSEIMNILTRVTSIVYMLSQKAIIRWGNKLECDYSATQVFVYWDVKRLWGCQKVLLQIYYIGNFWAAFWTNVAMHANTAFLPSCESNLQCISTCKSAKGKWY